MCIERPRRQFVAGALTKISGALLFPSVHPHVDIFRVAREVGAVGPSVGLANVADVGDVVDGGDLAAALALVDEAAAIAVD